MDAKELIGGLGDTEQYDNREQGEDPKVAMESIDRGEEAGLDAEEKQFWEIQLAKRLDLLTL